MRIHNTNWKTENKLHQRWMIPRYLLFDRDTPFSEIFYLIMAKLLCSTYTLQEIYTFDQNHYLQRLCAMGKFKLIYSRIGCIIGGHLQQTWGLFY